MKSLLCCQSHYSFLFGTASPLHLLKRAGELGFTSLAITDHASLCSLPLLVKEAQNLPCRVLYGATLTPANGATEVILLIEEEAGYAALCQIITNWHQETGRSSVEDIRLALGDELGGLVVLADHEAICRHLVHTARSDQIFFRTGKTLASEPLWVKALHLTSAFAPRVWMADQEEDEVHQLLRTIAAKGCWTSARERSLRADGRTARLYRPQEYEEYFSTLKEAMATSDQIAARLHFTPRPRALFPSNPHPGGSAIGRLRSMARQGAEERYGEITEAITTRLEHELGLIEAKGFAEYFLVVEDIVSTSPRTCGRGSGAASLVNYCLRVTNVDPLRYNLMFERFLNRGRMDPPDIDIDFAWDERDAVISAAFERYGQTSAAMVANHLTFQRRMALRETARCFGMSEEEITAALRWLPEEDCFTADEDLPPTAERGLAETDSPVWREILRLAARLVGLPRSLSLHCGGMVLVPGRISHSVPVEFSAKGLPMIQWEKDGTEEMGLVKIDLLGNRSLAVIRDAVRAIARTTGLSPEQVIPRIPADDPATRALIARGDTMGVFYVESPAMRLLQRRAQRGDFEHLVVHSSIIRPAANGYIQEYLRRLHGAPWEPLHPRLRGIFDESYGIPVYQEDVCRLAMALAGFDIVEADQLRKCLGKRDAARRLAIHRDRFFAGGSENGVSCAVLEEAWRMIMSMTGYSFCKPHSASYAQVSFESAWLKAHHPAAFMAAVLSNGGGFYSPGAYISEAMRLGLTILGPCLNHSFQAYTAENGALRVGLMAISGLHTEPVLEAVEERERKGHFLNLGDLQRRTRLLPDDLQRLTVVGALDAIAPTLNRPQILWLTCHREEGGRGQTPLFHQPPRVPTLPPYSLRQRHEAEYASLGYLLGAHPLILHREVIEACSPHVSSSYDIPAHAGRRITLPGWPVTGKVVSTRQDEAMEFYSFEDELGIYETVLFPEVYARYAGRLSPGRPVLVTGKVEEEWGTHTITVERIEPLERTVIKKSSTGRLTPARGSSSRPDALPSPA